MSNNNDNQKEEEIFYVRKFLEMYQIYGMLIEKQPNQIPDFLILKSDAILGLEMSEIKNHQPLVNGNRRVVIEEVNKILYGKIYFPVCIDIRFSGHEKIATRNRRAAINSICNSILLACKQINYQNEYKVITISDENICAYIDKMIIHCYPVNNINKLYLSVRYLEAGWVNQQPAKIINEYIEKKNSKISSYRKHCDELWLVLYNNPLYEEGHFLFNNINEINKKEFDKVIIMDYLAKKIIEI